MPFHIFFDKNIGQVFDLLLCSNMWTVDDVGMPFFSKDMGPQNVLNVFLHWNMVVKFISLVTSLMHFHIQWIVENLSLLYRIFCIFSHCSFYHLCILKHKIYFIGFLIMKYIFSQLSAVLNFLCSVPGPSGEPALHFVMIEWVGRQHVFYGSYEKKVSIMALAKILQHGVNSNDTRLQVLISNIFYFFF